MRIQYCSDLHLEFPKNKRYVLENPIEPVGDILVLAGDITPFEKINDHNDFFDYVGDNFSHTYWLPGNHEYYHSDISLRSGAFNERIRSNVSLVNNNVVLHKDFTLIFSTMWSRIGPLRETSIKSSMADFRLIKNYGKKLSIEDFNNLHAECMSFLTGELHRHSTSKRVVVTHHIPTFMNYPEKYRNSELNEAFVVELFDLIESSGVDFWIYGHSHENTKDFTIGKTKLLCNQLGYVEHGEHHSYSEDKTFTL